MRKFVLVAAFLGVSASLRADPLVPTGEGTTWEYDSTETLSGTAPVHSIITVRAGKELFDGKEVVKLETSADYTVFKTEIVRVDKSGITVLARTGKDGNLTKLTLPEPILATPLRAGTTWDLGSEVDGIKLHQVFTIVAEESVRVPAGRFKAFHLRSEDRSLISIKVDRWFVPGTGFIKETTVVRGPGLVHRLDLELNKISFPPPPTPHPAEEQSEPSPPSAAGMTPMTESSPSPPSSETSETTAPAKKLTVEVSGDPAGGLHTEFKPTVAHIYVRWHGHDLPKDAIVKIVWVAEDVGDLVEPNFVIDETESVAAVPNASARFTLSRPPDGWAEGKYRVEFYVNDELVETVKVTIEK